MRALSLHNTEKHMTFQPGQSGNPAGRPKGARGRAAILAEELFEGESGAIIRTAIAMAKAGDPSAVRICLDRIAPRPKDRAVAFELPLMQSAADAATALAAITAAVAAGDLTPSEAGELFKLVDGYARLLEATVFEQRVAKLEHAVSRLAAHSPQADQRHRNSQDDAFCQRRQGIHDAEP